MLHILILNNHVEHQHHRIIIGMALSLAAGLPSRENLGAHCLRTRISLSNFHNTNHVHLQHLQHQAEVCDSLFDVLSSMEIW